HERPEADATDALPPWRRSARHAAPAVLDVVRRRSCRLPGRSGLRRRVTGVRAILFDFGGTLDGAGQSWGDRFVAAYDAHDLAVPRGRLPEAPGPRARHADRAPGPPGIRPRAT